MNTNVTKIKKKHYMGKKCLFCKRTNFLEKNGYCDCLNAKYKAAWIKKSEKMLESGVINNIEPLDLTNNEHIYFAVCSYASRRGYEVDRANKSRRKYKMKPIY